jgi:DNA-binding response OmpR family regulator
MCEELSVQRVPIDEVPPADKPEKHRPVVLIVDDEEVIAETLALILTRNGFAPLTAYDGESALEIAEVIPPELLLSDVAMPGMNGIELAIAIVDKIADCKVLLFSGQCSTVDLLVEARAEGYDFPALTKPIHPEILIDCITRCLKGETPIVGLMHYELDLEAAE